jgi:hypothetical protein
MTGDFFIDLMSTIPFDYLFVTENTEKATATVLKLFKVLKVARVRKIPGIIRNMNVDLEFKTYLRIGTTILYLVVYFHLIACLLQLIFQSNDYVWWAPLDFSFYGLRDDPSQFMTLKNRSTLL